MGVILTDEMIKGAQLTQKKYGVPASITLGQIMLESGGNNPGNLSGLAYKYNNLFGIKGSGSGGSVKMATKEEGQGTVYANFAVYNSIEDSIEAHGKLLTNERYTKYTSTAKNVDEYAKGIHAGGYATDSQYSNKLISIIKSNNLTQYDNGIGSGYLTSNNDSNTDTLKWYGDLAVMLFIIILIIVGVILLVGAFGYSPYNKVKKSIKKKVKKK